MTYNHLNQLETSITSGVTTNYSYDDYGNLIEENDGTHSITYTYDLNNKLIGVVDGSSSLSFIYDGAGNRLSKVVDSIQVDYVNDITEDNTNVLSYQVDSATTNLVYGNELLSENSVFYLSDAYGNIVQHGSESYAYDPYGALTEGSIDSVNEVGYKGEVHDTSDLQYLRARTYSTKLHQFLTEDTYTGQAGSPLSQNRYIFALNNPFKYSDPTGHYFVEEDVVLTGSQTAQAIQNSYEKATSSTSTNSGAPLYDDLAPTIRPPKIDSAPPLLPGPIYLASQALLYDDLEYQVVKSSPVLPNNQSYMLNYISPETFQQVTEYKRSSMSIQTDPYNTYNGYVDYKGNMTREQQKIYEQTLNPAAAFDQWKNEDVNRKAIFDGIETVVGGVVTAAVGVGTILGAATAAPIIATIVGIAGVGSLLYGLSNAFEGIHKLSLGLNGHGGDRSFNLIRDTLFLGNSDLYLLVGATTTLFSASGLGAIAGGATSGMKFATSVLTQLTKFSATGALSIGVGSVVEAASKSETLGKFAAITTAIKTYPHISKGIDKAISVVSDVASNISSYVNANKVNSKNDLYTGVKEASEFLKSQNVPRDYRKQILESFDVRTIKMETAGDSTYGIRFYGGNAQAKGRYLFETFSNTTNRNNLALPNQFNTMTGLQQFQVKSGTQMITGNTAPQLQYGSQYLGGAKQWYISNLEALLK